MYYLMNKNEKIAKTAFEGGSAWAASEHNIPGVWHGWFICQVLDQTSPMQWNRTNLPTVVLITGSMDRGSVTNWVKYSGGMPDSGDEKDADWNCGSLRLRSTRNITCRTGG